MVSWKNVTLSKVDGGLGIQRASLKNNSLLMSLSWRVMHQPESLWVKVLKRKYSQDSMVCRGVHQSVQFDFMCD